MSSTRRSTDGVFHQERYCSAPEFEGDSINGLAASKKISIVKDRAAREILWFIQWRSLSPGGLQQLCDDLLTTFPERVGTSTLRKVLARKTPRPSRSELDAIESEYEGCRIAAIDDFLDDPNQGEKSHAGRSSARSDAENSTRRSPEQYMQLALDAASETLRPFLLRCCLDPSADISEGVWFFDDLFGALIALRDRFIRTAQSRLADTIVTQTIHETLDFWFARERMVLIEGVAGIGRTATARTWCEAHTGLVRYVEVPSSSDDRSFFASIARQLGIARGASFKAQQIKVRVEEMLATSGLGLVLDESQYLFGQYIRPRRTPDRLLWVKTVFDAGTPIALIAHTDFSKWQSLFVKQTLWTDEQFERRLNRRVVLPAEHSREDMLKIARSHFPDGDSRCWSLLAGYALGTEKKQASGIVEALESARYRAQQAGRDRVTFADIEAALTHDHAFLTPPVAPALQRSSTGVAKAVKAARNDQADASILPRDRDRFGPLSVSLST